MFFSPLPKSEAVTFTKMLFRFIIDPEDSVGAVKLIRGLIVSLKNVTELKF